MVSVRKSTKNLSKIAKELGEVGARCNELTTIKSKLLEGVRDEKMQLQRMETKIATSAAVLIHKPSPSYFCNIIGNDNDRISTCALQQNTRKLHAEHQKLQQLIHGPRYVSTVCVYVCVSLTSV